MIHKNSKGSKTAVMMVAISALILAAFIPGLIVADESNAASTYELDIVPGMKYEYTPTYNISPVTTTILKQGDGVSGSGGTWGTISNGKLTVNIPSGATVGEKYNVTLRGTSSNPTQTIDTQILFTIVSKMSASGYQSNIVEGGSVSMTPTATGFGSPFTWSVTSGKDLPTGLTFNESTGKVTGTPSGVGSKTIYLTATSTIGETVNLTVTFDIVPKIGTTNEPTGGSYYWVG